jgi:hypothetical protein
MKKKYFLILLILVLGATLLLGRFYLKNQNSQTNNENDIAISKPIQIVQPGIKEEITKEEVVKEPAEKPLPDSYLIKNFPFQTQAPNANWDLLHEEACEEASVILVNYYLNNKDISAETMDKEIHKLVDWQVEIWGLHKDLTVNETIQLASKNYQLNLEAIDISSIDDLKKIIAQGHPIIVPTAGRELGNPNFKQPGPIYHMLVAIGYKDNRIIVQDVGTRNGDHYEYNQTIFYNAIHDWNDAPEKIDNGSKRILKVLD